LFFLRCFLHLLPCGFKRPHNLSPGANAQVSKHLAPRKHSPNKANGTLVEAPCDGLRRTVSDRHGHKKALAADSGQRACGGIL